MRLSFAEEVEGMEDEEEESDDSNRRLGFLFGGSLIYFFTFLPDEATSIFLKGDVIICDFCLFIYAFVHGLLLGEEGVQMEKSQMFH